MKFVRGHSNRRPTSEVIDGRVELFGLHGEGRVALVDAEDEELVRGFRWHVGASGYVVHSVNAKKKLWLHRLVWPDKESPEVDHVNGDLLDCRKKNLRSASRSENSRNRVGPGGASPYKGVSPRPSGKWAAKIGFEGRELYLGLFGTEEEAATAYNRAAIELHGEFARLNEIGKLEMDGMKGAAGAARG